MGTRPRLAAVKDREVNVNINGEKLKQVHNCKHLGVIVDESLTWHEQVCNIKKKVLPGIYMLRKCKGLLPAKTLSPFKISCTGGRYRGQSSPIL